MEINLEINRVFAGFGGLFGAAGIAAYAAAAHSPDGHMATIAPILFQFWNVRFSATAGPLD